MKLLGIPILSATLILTGGLYATNAEALLLCVRTVRPATLQSPPIIRDGSKVVLRRECRRREVSIGTSQQLAGLQNQVAANATAIAGLEQVPGLSDVVSVDTVNQVVRFEGVNVQIVSGSGRTDDNTTTLTGGNGNGSLRGLGNLIIGYDEDNNNTRTGSHNVVVGSYHNYSSFGGLLAGYRNSVSAPFASASGGDRNNANGWYSSISGGYQNSATGVSGSVLGGHGNDAAGENSTVIGGQGVVATETYGIEPD